MEGETAGEGREIQRGNVHIMWNGVWVKLGTAEFLVENRRVVKVLSFTPREFHDKESDAPIADGMLEEQRTGEDS